MLIARISGHMLTFFCIGRSGSAMSASFAAIVEIQIKWLYLQIRYYNVMKPVRLNCLHWIGINTLMIKGPYSDTKSQ